MPQKKKNLNFRKRKLTDALRKKYGMCEHNEVNYKTVEKCCKQLFKRLESDQKQFKILAEDIRHKNNQLRIFYINTHKNAKKVNEVFDRYKEANDNLVRKNKELIKDNFDLTRAYNGLSKMGQFAEELGVDIKKYNGELPENNKWHGFEEKHTLSETGKIKHQYKLKRKKEGQND